MRGLRARLAAGIIAALVLSGVPDLAASAAPAVTEVRGTVTDAGRPVAGVRVGAWSPTKGQQSRGVTDAHGGFVLPAPAGVAVEVWAGSAPGAAHAVFAAGARHLVRGVIGAAAPAGAPSALGQRVTPALPSRLGGGRTLQFRLQRAGRFTSSVPVGGTGRIALDRGGLVSHWTTARAGVIDSGWLVPGRYRVYWDPSTGRLAARSWVVVPAGTSATAPPVLPVSTTLSIRVSSAGTPVGAGVPVVQLVAGGELPSGTTDASGTVVLRGLEPGTIRFAVGRYRSASDEDPAGPPTSDDDLPAAPIAVSIRPGQAAASAAVDVAPAAHILGRVAQRGDHPVRVLAEDAAGHPVRSGFAEHGAFSLGGLTAGTYRVIAEDLDAAVYAATGVTVTAGATATVPSVLTPTTADPVVSGRTNGSRGGSVHLRSTIDPRIFDAADDWEPGGAFRIPVVPGRFTPVVLAAYRSPAVEPAVTVTTSGTLHLAAGIRTATVRAQPRIHENAVQVELLLKGPRLLGEEFIEGPQSSDTYSIVTVAREARGTGLPAGRYRVVGVDAPLPAADGPWSYRTEARAFTLRAGRTTDLGVLRVAIAG